MSEAEEEGDAKPAAKLKLFVKHPDNGQPTQIMIKPHMRMNKLFNRYAKYLGEDVDALLFVDGTGRHLNRDDTPEELGLDDGDEIKCIIRQQQDEQEEEQHEEEQIEIDTPTKTPKITIYLKHQDGRAPTEMRVKTTIKMERIFTAYANQLNVDLSSLRFYLDETRIQEEDTPESLEMNDGDQINVYLEQEGGGSKDNNTMHSKSINQQKMTRNLSGLIGPTIAVLILTENPYINPELYLTQSPPIVYLNGTILFCCWLGHCTSAQC